MNEGLLKQVLNCATLPSLPAVAVRVIELTSDKNVKVQELATTIAHDQGLSAKILRTVNSSFYGVRTRVATIDKAIVMLGLAPVKVLALGFSLVSSVGEDDSGFDYVSYWRRGLYTAVAAKLIADAAEAGSADECFLGGLLQDVGMVALHRTLGRDYIKVVQTAGDHRNLAKAELESLDAAHTDIGAMLCQKWRLPDELILPVKYHERPTAAPVEHGAIVRCVGLANFVHDALTDAEPAGALRRLYERGAQWLELQPGEIDGIISRVGAAAKEMSDLFKLNTGRTLDSNEIMQRAEAGKKALEQELAEAAAHRPGLESLVASADDRDAMTGLGGRHTFEAALKAGERGLKAGGRALSLVQITLDNYRQIVQKFGEPGGDEVVTAAAAALASCFTIEGATVCRLGPEIFGVVLEGGSLDTAKLAAEKFRSHVGDASALEVVKGVPIKVSIGVSSVGAGGAIDQLVRSAMTALKNARAGGGGNVQASAAAA
jgi:two-component system, cell cycle response regulator